MDWLRRRYPFNAEQTVNIVGEFGPLVALFIVNALYGVIAGTWALMITTAMSMVVMLVVLGRLPAFPLISCAVTLAFGFLTIQTGDGMWVQLKVTIFNLMFAAFLGIGLLLKKNFFRYVFGKTFHYTTEGWTKFTLSFALFFVFTAIVNEVLRLGFSLDVWILAKVFFVMPVSALFAWWQTRLMHPYRLDPATVEVAGAGQTDPAMSKREFATVGTKSSRPR